MLIIIITADGNVIDRVVGLEPGADDYLTKPFHVREVFGPCQGNPAPNGTRHNRHDENPPIAEASGHRFELDMFGLDFDRRELIARNGQNS